MQKLSTFLELTNKMRNSISFDVSTRTFGFAMAEKSQIYSGKYAGSGAIKILSSNIVNNFFKSNTTINDWSEAKNLDTYSSLIYNKIIQDPTHVESNTILNKKCSII